MRHVNIGDEQDVLVLPSVCKTTVISYTYPHICTQELEKRLANLEEGQRELMKGQREIVTVRMCNGSSHIISRKPWVNTPH